VKPARGKTPGLAQPLRIDGSLSGVRFELPRSIHGLLDCRLVLLLDDLAKDLSARGVKAVIVNNVYRPGSKLPEPTPRSSLRVSQHALGLAIDITAFELEDATLLDVERDWHGALGAAPCGPSSTVLNDNPAGITLRNLTCAIAAAGYCNHLITPNRDAAHANHLHCDIEAGAREVTVE
jgi:hypothetical protein